MYIAFLDSIHPTAKLSEGANRKLPARNTPVQFLALHTDPESHNTQRHRRTDGRHHDANRQTDGWISIYL